MRASSAKQALVVAVVVAFVAAAAEAHEFWVQPATHAPAPGSVLRVALRVGDGFPGDAHPRKASHALRFELVGPKYTQRVVGREGADPAGVVRLRERGVHWLVYRSARTRIVLPAEKFEAYLKEEGLESISLLRKKRGTSKHEGREVYSRCAKALVRVGTGSTAGFDRRLGMDLEIVPVSDPLAVRAGDAVTFLMLSGGKPLAGVRVNGFHASVKGPALHGRTDARGRVRLVLDKPGRWLIGGVQMVKAPAGLDADWESRWASLTFELAPAAKPKASRTAPAKAKTTPSR